MTARCGKDYLQLVEGLLHPRGGSRLETKRKNDAVAISLNLHVIETATKQTAAGRGQFRQRNLDIKAIATLVSFIVIDRSVRDYVEAGAFGTGGRPNRGDVLLGPRLSSAWYAAKGYQKRKQQSHDNSAPMISRFSILDMC